MCDFHTGGYLLKCLSASQTYPNFVFAYCCVDFGSIVSASNGWLIANKNIAPFHSLFVAEAPQDISWSTLMSWDNLRSTDQLGRKKMCVEDLWLQCQCIWVNLSWLVYVANKIYALYNSTSIEMKLIDILVADPFINMFQTFFLCDLFTRKQANHMVQRFSNLFLALPSCFLTWLSCCLRWVFVTQELVIICILFVCCVFHIFLINSIQKLLFVIAHVQVKQSDRCRHSSFLRSRCGCASAIDNWGIFHQRSNAVWWRCGWRVCCNGTWGRW